METVASGTLAGAGTFRCENCGFPVALHERDVVPSCPHCGELKFVRSSLFGGGEPEPMEAHGAERPDWLDEARGALVADGDYLAFDDDERVRVVVLQDGFTRLGRSLGAHVRFDDPTVSRRHAVVHRERGETKLLDDRSLNGVFVNGERREWHTLADGDEIVIGRFRLYFISLAGSGRSGERAGTGTTVG